MLLCPHCQGAILIEQVNCGIFRHGVLKKTNRQMPPHAPEKYCDTVVKQDLIHGCGKPFRVMKEEGVLTAVGCDYI